MKIIKVGALWCPGCLVMKKAWNNIQREYSDIEMIELDYDIDKKDIEKYNVGREIPVVIFLDNTDSEILRIRGEQDEDTLRKMIDRCRDIDEKNI